MNVFGQERKTRVYRKIAYFNPLEVFSRILEFSKNACLFEYGGTSEARYSVVLFNPAHVFSCSGGKLFVDGCKTTQSLSDLINSVCDSGDAANFTGGLCGYTGFNYASSVEGVRVHKSVFPDAEYGFFTECMVFDNFEKTCVYYGGEDKDFNAFFEKIMETGIAESLAENKLECTGKGFHYSKQGFEELVLKAKEFLYSGDVFQLVVSNKYYFDFKGDLFSAYRALRKNNPSRYHYFLKFGDRIVAGASPENFCSIRSKQVYTYPIAGTKPRGESASADAILARELQMDEKEKAEHLMLVDLARNDVGRVSKPGSVSVTSFMKLKKFSTVQHLVSRVEGRLAEGESIASVFNSLFPAGTVSGAPKKRACELIYELEDTGRGPYAGAVGLFGFGGFCEQALCIRSFFCCKNTGFAQAGAGIVLDSVPANEHAEVLSKIAPVLSCLGVVE